ncbi:ABC transporter ATP-binding protein [Abyssisolibacter fermentans]|uniref:ABC transporter ATP-binding protein n=1 Tax=Abyssisolibacter fermentans TaxID=1766203 RepID=UPI00083241AD|nr:ABC transporter ATP-binding protein [Abyssisolibacter fermentans]
MIKVKGLNFSYKKGIPILKDINFSVEKGEIFGFLGPNGSGKSTTQKILTGLLNHHKGEVKIAGKEIKNHGVEIYNDIGVLFELPYLYNSLSAVDNLKYFGSFYPKEQLRDIDEVLELVNLKKEYRRKAVKRYSKGMRQRASFARVLMSNPKILFLDEPISGLDPAGAILIKKIIKEEREKGTTIFITTHNMYVADELCDKVAFIIDGDIKAMDAPKILKNSEGQNLVDVEYELNGISKQITLNTKEILNGFPFKYDIIKGIHTKELSMEDVFIKVTGRGLK